MYIGICLLVRIANPHQSFSMPWLAMVWLEELPACRRLGIEGLSFFPLEIKKSDDM
jgi:hypothetical protein